MIHISYKGYDICSENKTVMDLYYDHLRDNKSFRNATASIIKSLKDEKDTIVSNLAVVRNIHNDIMCQTGVSDGEKENSHNQFIAYEDAVLNRLAEIEKTISDTYDVYIDTETKYVEDFMSNPEKFTRSLADKYALHIDALIDDYREFVSLHDEYMTLVKDAEAGKKDENFAENQKFYYEELKHYPFFDIKKGDNLMRIAEKARKMYTELTEDNSFQPEI